MQTQLEGQPEPQPDVKAQATEPAAHWSLGLKIGFRFAFAYFVLFCFPFPIGSLPYTEKPAGWYNQLWDWLVAWVGKHLLHLANPISFTFTGSGDTTNGYVLLLCQLVLAAMAVALWSVLDRRRPNYWKLHAWLRLYVSLTLGSSLLSYGAYKVIPSQFPAPWLWRYMETYGDSSPMGLLWTFMGASKAYTIFAGSVEMLGGALLFVRRLSTLGALISVGAMGNVFMLNMCYDVPVKLYSFQLLAMSAFLVMPELRRLADVFIFNRVAEPVIYPPLFARKWLTRSLLIAQLTLGLWFVGADLYQSHKTVKNLIEDAKVKAPLYGYWSVDEFAIDGVERPLLITDDLRWQKAIFDLSNVLAVQGMNGTLQRFRAQIDIAKKTVTLTKRDNKWKAVLIFDNPTPELMTMDGPFGGQQVHIKLHHYDPKYLLNTRGFHWINEIPYNR